MPHQCTNCGRTFADGSKQMLSGCPDCGGNKFQYHPGDVPADPPDDEPPERPDDAGVTGTVGKAAAKVRDFVGEDSPPVREQSAASPDAADAAATTDDAAGEQSRSGGDAATDATVETGAEAARDDEDVAQASARTEMVDEADLPDDADGRVVSAPSGDDRPDMEALREELNSQFESIRIVAPGTYELNLMELYDREEYVIALQENGRYVIEVPDAWDASRNDPSE